MTLKTILKNFLNYADTLEAQKKLGKDLYEVDFQKLKALTEELKHDKDYACSEGLKEVNRRKNRYKDILPYDYTRVILSEYPGVPGSDYINANYIKGASGSLAYIASQGPLPNTVVDFWRMIWECEIQVIVMACNEQESGKYKCECYWPTDEEKKQYGNINVEFVKWRQVCPDFLVRTLKACWENEERVICQFHYTTWPDHGVPNSVQPILELVRLIRDCQASEAVPVLVHCSAGCGRTGTICAIDYVWGLMRMGKLSKNFNLYNVIADMRKQRIAMVQTKEQYVLVHKAVSSLFEQQLRVIDSHTYENLDQDGEPLILKELNQQDEDIYEDILEPPLTEEPYVSEERKLPSSKIFHEQASENKDVTYISKKESSENLPNSAKSAYCKSENDSRQNEVQVIKNTVSCNRVENSKSEHNIKGTDNEPDNVCSRNSKILLKLCREESVKRLISGWNKAVEQTDDTKPVPKETHADNDVTLKSPVTKKFSDHLMCDSKPVSSNDVTFSQKTDSGSVCTDNPHRIDILCDDNITSDTSPKTSSPEDTHAGKLVGKATVIRRPSIAKLKALFEKTSQGNADFTDSARQRRPLFRSHSHYVSHSSRQFTVSDTEDQNFNSNQEVGISSVTSNEECSTRKDNTGPKSIADGHIVHNFQNSGNTNIQHFIGNCIAESAQASGYSEQFIRDSVAELQITEDNKQKYLLKYSKSSSATDNNKDHSTISKENSYSTQYLGNCSNDFHHTADESKQKTSVKYRIHSIPSDTFKDTTKVSYVDKNQTNEKAECISEIHSNSEALANSKMKLKQCQSVTFKKEKPPDLPVKKKPAVPLPHSENSAEKSLAENVVPRFQINMPKLSHVFSESQSKSCNTSVSSDATPNKVISPHEMTYKIVKSVVPAVTNQDWNSEDSLREYRRHSQEVERRVLHKNQSFSDPEQSTTRSHDTSKQVVKPKLSLTDETHPKLTYSSGKSAVNDKSSFSPDCTYMNVNSLAQKNIRQIEDKLRDHPRGAIIDLTSRKSYIDDMNTTTEKQYIFRNTVQPVKFSQRQETRDLTTAQAKSNIIRPEISTLKNSSAKCFPSVHGPKTAESKTETSKNDLDNINSKNLLLHSPPPKSKRGHPSKSNSIVSSSLPSANAVTDASPNNSKIASNVADNSKQTNTSFSSSSNTTITTSSTTTMADRSDPRYFPVTRQTASDARYECEKQKASSRENFNTSRTGNLYESHYSIHPSTSVYHKLPLPYDKTATEYDKYTPKLILKDVKYAHESNKNNSYDKEPLYGLQRSTSGPQILPSTSDTSQKTAVGSEANRSFTLYNQVSEESRKPKSAPAVETRQQSHYNQNTSFGLYGAIGQQHSFPPGPPKPPRTFHYDLKSSQERIPQSEVYKGDQNIKRDGGRYIVSVASPKHSSQHPVLQATKNSSQEYRYPDDHLTESAHRSSNNSQLHQSTYGSSLPNEVHMSRSYPFATYDSLYSHPRPYGKQFYPESIGYRNVQPLTHVTSNVYSSVKEKPVHMHQNIYGTVKHRNTFSDYENVYDAQADYLHAMSNVGIKNEHQNQYQSINCNPTSGLQYSQSDASVYAVLQGQKSQVSKSAHIPMDADYREVNKSAGNVPLPKRVYFDTLQRRQKQHVMWEQRRSHDDMDIRPAPSARLREQIHARRSMVELDNLEISIASDEGYPEKNISDASMSPTAHGSKIPSSKNDRVSETNHSKSHSENTDFARESQHKKCSAHNKEPVSFGETLSKAFGKLTSFTKLNAKEAQSNSNPSDNGRSSSKASKQKDKEKAHNFSLQSPVNPKELPSEQWTQV